MMAGSHPVNSPASRSRWRQGVGVGGTGEGELLNLALRTMGMICLQFLTPLIGFLPRAASLH